MKFNGAVQYNLSLEGPNVQIIAHVQGHPTDVICGGHFPHKQAREFAQAILELADRAEVAEGLELGGIPQRSANVILPSVHFGLHVQGSA